MSRSSWAACSSVGRPPRRWPAVVVEGQRGGWDMGVSQDIRRLRSSSPADCPRSQFADLAVLAEALGYSRVWIYDSAPLWEDPFVHLALAAVRTTRIGLATAVLVPSERSLLSMASAIATMSDSPTAGSVPASGPDSRAQGCGHGPLRLDSMFDYVRDLRRLLAGEHALIDHGTAGTHAARFRLDLGSSHRGPAVGQCLRPRGIERGGGVRRRDHRPAHPVLPTATLASGTVLEPGEDAGSARVGEAHRPVTTSSARTVRMPEVERRPSMNYQAARRGGRSSKRWRRTAIATSSLSKATSPTSWSGTAT